MRLLLDLLFTLLPPAFRDRFGVDMREQIETDYAIARSKGIIRAVAFSAATGWDLVCAAVAERWEPAWVDRTSRNTGGGGAMAMRNAWDDLGYAGRALKRAPGFTAIASGTLALALGAVAGVFSIVDTVLLDPLPYPEADRLVAIRASAPGSELPEEFPASAEFFFAYQDAGLLAGLAVYNTYTNTLRVGDRIERVIMASPTASLFEVLGVEPVLGRLPAESEDDVVVLSHALWSTWFANDPAAVGQTVYAGGGDRTVIGVMGPEFWFDRDDVLLWVPGVPRREAVQLAQFTGQTQLVGRLAPGATAERLVDELAVLARRLPERFGGSPAYARVIAQHRPVVRPLEEQVFGQVSDLLWILFGSVSVVLLIACANVSNLFFVRAEDRLRDVAVRRALGAGRARMIASSLAEAGVVAVLAAVVGVGIAWLGVPALLAAAPPGVPRLARVEVTGGTLVFTALLAALCALACGAAPAVWSSAPDLGRLREGGRGSVGRRHSSRDGLVALQTALGLVLLIGSGLLLRSFQQLRRVDPGYDVADVFTFQLGAEDEDGLTDGPSYARFHLAFLERLRALPAVEFVGIVENVPLNEGVRTGRYRTEDRADDPEAAVLLSYTWVAGDYFAAMGIELLEGRALRPEDHAVGVGNVVVGRAAAARLWPGESALGRRLTSETSGVWYTVVGVVEDVLQYSFRADPEPLVYLPLVGATPTSWVLTSPAYVVKTARAEEIGPEIRALARDVAPTAPMFRVFTMAGLAADSMLPLTFTALALAVASALALVLGAIGLYGVLSYVVTQRTREIGVRMALGAKAARVRRMVVAQGTRVVLAGIAIGVVAAIGVTRVLRGLLFGVEPADVATFAAMSTAMIVVGLLASYLPARRASSVDPVESLRGS